MARVRTLRLFTPPIVRRVRRGNCATAAVRDALEPVEMCTRLPVRLLGDADPWGVIETFCIVIFTVEFCLRLCSCSAGPGLLRFCSSLPNLIDLVAIVPWLPEA